VLEHQLVFLGPAVQHIQFHAGIAHIRQRFHQKPVPAGSGQGIDDMDFAAGIFFHQFVSCDTGGIVSPRNTA
jgi:hypothetical protein